MQKKYRYLPRRREYLVYPRRFLAIRCISLLERIMYLSFKHNNKETILGSGMQKNFAKTYDESKTWMNDVSKRVVKLSRINKTIEKTLEFLLTIEDIKNEGAEFIEKIIQNGDSLKEVRPETLHRVAEQQTEIIDLWETVLQKFQEVDHLTKRQQAELIQIALNKITRNSTDIRTYLETCEEIHELGELKTLFKKHADMGKIINEPSAE